MDAQPAPRGDERDVFVSHSTKDREVASWVCSQLEEQGVSVWVAPRDVRPGRNYAEEIIHAIESTRITILVMSDHANQSVHVQHEVERAVSKGKAVFPVRVADVEPARALELFVSAAQWIDIFGPSRQAGIDRLVRAAKEYVGHPYVAPPPRARGSATVSMTPPPAPRSASRPLLAAAIGLAVVLAGAGVAWQQGWIGARPALTLTLSGAPEATVHIDGRRVGTAMQGMTKRIPMSDGPHMMRVEAPGYWPYEQDLHVDTGDDEPLIVRLTKKSSLAVTVATSGARVLLNGEPVSKPFPLELPDGQYTVDVKADGYVPYRQLVALAGGQQQTVAVSLVPERKPEAVRVVRPAAAQDDDRPRTSGSFNPRVAQEQQQQAQPNRPSAGQEFMRGLGQGVGQRGFGGFPHP